MIDKFVQAWDKNKETLRDYIRTHKTGEYDEYKTLVKLLFDIVINPECDEYEAYKTDEILEIDDGSYQGTLIFILHTNICLPTANDYVYTSVDYGSCTYCDTLLSINGCIYDHFPTEKQINDYMTLLLHLLQSCHRMKGE